MNGATQLRAKRTRIKILRAIADRNGAAGFSDIKVSTGLSTGSIYYHLDRMGNYVTKDSKQYLITEHGLQLLREVDLKYAQAASARQAEETTHEPVDIDSQPAGKEGEESARASRNWKASKYGPWIVGALTVALGVSSLATN